MGNRTAVTTALAVLLVLLALALGVPFAHERTPSRFDGPESDAAARLGTGVLRVLVLPTEPYVLLPVLALAALYCVWRVRPWDTLFAIGAPAVAVALNTWVLKPAYGRWKDGTLVYPSGHTVSLVATLVVLALLAHGTARVFAIVVSVLVFACAATGLVGLGYHYPTDVLGGALFAAGLVLALRPRTRRRARARSAG